MRRGGASFDEAGVESNWVRSQAVNPQSEWSDGAEALFERPGGKRRLSGSSPRGRRLKHGACFHTLSTIPRHMAVSPPSDSAAQPRPHSFGVGMKDLSGGEVV
jgi:hypothetical protein